MDKVPLLTVVLPVFNEEKTIVQILDLIFQSSFDKQVVAVDDGSTDDSGKLLDDYAAKSPLELIRHDQNCGKGAAIRSALSIAKGELFIVQDADLEYQPSDYQKLVGPIVSGEADVVFGSRRLGKNTTWQDWKNPFFHGVTSLNVLVWLLYGQRITDEATCYKVFKTSLLREMNLGCEGFEFCPEVTGKACRMNLRINEVPIGYQARSMDDGKKIRFRDWVEAVRTLWKYRKWTPENQVSDVSLHRE